MEDDSSGGVNLTVQANGIRSMSPKPPKYVFWLKLLLIITAGFLALGSGIYLLSAILF